MSGLLGRLLPVLIIVDLHAEGLLNFPRFGQLLPHPLLLYPGLAQQITENWNLILQLVVLLPQHALHFSAALLTARFAGKGASPLRFLWWEGSVIVEAGRRWCERLYYAPFLFYQVKCGLYRRLAVVREEGDNVGSAKVRQLGSRIGRVRNPLLRLDTDSGLSLVIVSAWRLPLLFFDCFVVVEQHKILEN